MERSLTIDRTKGLLIILVVLGHSLQYGYGADYSDSLLFYDDYLFRAIYTFHMPLFMFISGYLFYNSNQRSFGTAIGTKLIYIGIPFLAYLSMWYVLWWHKSGMEVFYVSDFMRKMRGNMWFLSSLLLNSFIVACVTRLCNQKMSIVILLLLSILSLFIDDELLPAAHKFVYVFFVLGFFSKTVATNLYKFLKDRLAFGVLTPVFLCCVLVYDADMTIYEGGLCIIHDGQVSLIQLYIDGLRLLIGVASSCWFMSLVFIINHRCKLVLPFLANLGKKTLGIYGMQSILFFMVNYIMDVADLHIPRNPITPILLSGFILLCCECLMALCDTNAITRLVFLGKKNNKHEK